MKLQKLMDGMNISQGKLSLLTGVSQAHISRLISGKQQPTLPTLQKLAKGLGVTVAELIDEQTATSEPPNPAA